MRLGVMQPYFFPNLAHLALIAATDEWVVFDVTQYTPKSWMTRNRILHPDSGWNYVNLPVRKNDLGTRIWQMRVADPDAAHRSVCGKLSHYRKHAPHFESVLNLVDRTFREAADDRLVSLNVAGLRAVCELLDIPFRYEICSELGLTFPDEMGPGDWAPFISSELGASDYVNPAGGRDLFNPADFADLGIRLWFAHFKTFTYDAGPFEFEDGLSVLDVLMWNSPVIVRSALMDGLTLEVASGKSAGER